MDKFRDTLPSAKRAYEDNEGLMKGKFMPSLSIIKFFLESLLSTAQISKTLIALCRKAYERITADISKALFMSLNVVGVAIVSRIATLLECLFAASTHCYAAWRPAMAWVQAVRFLFP